MTAFTLSGGSISMARPVLHAARLALAAMSLMCAPAFAAISASPASGATPTASPAPRAPAIEPIDPSSIPLRADIDERFAREVIARAQEPDPAQSLLAPLEAIDAGARRLAERHAPSTLQSLSAMRLESLARYWKFYDDRLARWRSDLQRVMGRYSDAAAEIAKRRAVWEATRTAAAASGLAPALTERVNAVLGEFAQAEQALSAPLDSQLRLARRGNAVRAAVDSGTKAVDAAFDQFDHRLFEIDAPSLAQAWRDRNPSGAGLAALLQGYDLEVQFLTEYNAVNARRLDAQRLVELALLPLLIWVGRRYRKLARDDDDAQMSAPVLQRPLAAWLVIVLVGVLYWQPSAPMLKHEVALLLVLLPVLRLLPPRVYAILGRWPYYVAAVYVFFQLGFLLTGVPLVERLHLIVAGLLGLGAAIWLLARLRRRRAVVVNRWHAAVLRTGAVLFAVALAAGLVAGVVGNVSLAEALTAGVVDSLYIGLAMYAAAAVARGVLALLPAHRASATDAAGRRGHRLLQSLARLLNIAAFLVWVFATLVSFRVYRPIAEAASEVLAFPIKFGKLAMTPGGILLFAISVVLSFGIARTIRMLLEDEVLPRMTLPRGVGNSIATLTYYAIVIGGLMLALLAAGFEVGQLAIVIGALGVGIGFGLQNVVNNFVSGLILMFERPIQPGDVIEVTGTAGTVREIGMRATRLRTFEGADIVVPNGTLLAEKLTNWTLSDMTRRFDITVGVAYGSDVERVLAVLGAAVKDAERIAESPAPMVIFSGFGESSLDFVVRAWTNDFDNWVATRSNLTLRIHNALKAAGIEIPFPQRDLHLRSVAPEVRVGGGGGQPEPTG
jgi:potassium efflux system protein